jgi:hypothetical protein
MWCINMAKTKHHWNLEYIHNIDSFLKSSWSNKGGNGLGSIGLKVKSLQQQTHLLIFWFNLVKELFQSNSPKDNIHRNLNHHVCCMQYNICNSILKHYAKGIISWIFICLKINKLNLHTLYLIASYGVHTSLHWKPFENHIVHLCSTST